MSIIYKARLSLASMITPKDAWRPKDLIIGAPPFHDYEVGTSGTEIYGGYLHEEYLRDIQGREWASIVDKIRRSDSNASMALKALKLPIKSANWYVEQSDKIDRDDVSMVAIADRQKLLIEKALFKDNQKSFTRLLGEILTMYDHGYSLFEVTYRAKFGDRELGTYNTLRSIAFRSQKTIEKWNVDRNGTLLSVTQTAYGDLGRLVDMDAQFLMHFAPEMEGDNFEGISILRTMYGNWLRKNSYLQWLAAGNEKSAIPTPTLKIPASKVGDQKERAAALKMLKDYASNSCNYILFPEGWELSQFKIDFDPEKMLKSIIYEDQSMVNSILASFLLLGQGGNGGSLALGKDLSNFFGQTFQCTTDYISEVFQKNVIDTLIKMNFGDEPCYVSLKCESLKDDADEVFATTLKTFVDSKVIVPDSPLEKFIREKFQYPKADPESARQIEPPAAAPFNGQARFSEKKKRTPPELIRQTALELRDVFESQVSAIGMDYVQAIVKMKATSPDSYGPKVPNVTEIPNYKFYKDIVSFLNIEAALTATGQLVNDGVKLSEESKLYLSVMSHTAKSTRLEEILQKITELSSRYSTSADYMRTKSELYKLRREFSSTFYSYKSEIPQWKSSKLRVDIEAKVSTLIDTQMNDLKKKIDLQYQSSLRSTDSAKQFEFDLLEAKDNYSGSANLSAGADIIASQTVNDVRLQVSLEDPDVESYTFVAIDDNSTTDICLELNGRTFLPNDPMLDRYSPPLHYNCRSYLQINMRNFKDNPEITTTPFAPSEAAVKSISLSEKIILACSHKHKDN